MKLLQSDYDPTTGITEEYWYDEPTNKLTIRRLQDIEDDLDVNKEMYNNTKGYADSNGVHLVARIPFIVIEKWLREDGFDWYKATDKERRRKLNDPENRYLLTRQGKL